MIKIDGVPIVLRWHVETNVERTVGLGERWPSRA
jgi:hypothetical protein